MTANRTSRQVQFKKRRFFYFFFLLIVHLRAARVTVAPAVGVEGGLVVGAAAVDQLDEALDLDEIVVVAVDDLRHRCRKSTTFVHKRKGSASL